MRKRSTVASIPNIHEACEAAIECGAEIVINIKNTKAARSRKRTIAFSVSMPATLSSRSNIEAINAIL